MLLLCTAVQCIQKGSMLAAICLIGDERKITHNKKAWSNITGKNRLNRITLLDSSSSHKLHSLFVLVITLFDFYSAIVNSKTATDHRQLLK